MRRLQVILLTLYAALLRLYPLSFRLEFGTEMRADFAACLQDAWHQLPTGPFIVLWRELCDLPGNLLREHLAQRRKPALIGPPVLPPPRRYAINGALGFSLGMWIVLFGRQLLDPQRRPDLYSLGVDILLFGLLGGLGGLLLSSTSRSKHITGRMTLAGALGFGVGIIPADLLARQAAYYTCASSTPGLLPGLLQAAALAAGTICMGGLTGLLYGILQHNLLLARRLAYTNALGFGLAAVLLQISTRLIVPLFPQPLSISLWLSLPAYALFGIVGGAILGWTFGKQTL